MEEMEETITLRQAADELCIPYGTLSRWSSKGAAKTTLLAAVARARLELCAMRAQLPRHLYEPACNPCRLVTPAGVRAAVELITGRRLLLRGRPKKK